MPWADPAKVDLKKLRVAFCADNGAKGRNATDEDTKKTVRQAAKWLEGADVPSVNEDVPQEILVELGAARQQLSSGDAGAFYKRLADKWGTRELRAVSASRTMATQTPLTSAAMVEAWEKQDECKSRMLEWMTQYDVFICPTSGKPAQPIDAETGRWRRRRTSGADGGWPYTGVFNCTGWPVVVVRCGSSADGKLPIGVQIVAAPWREDIAIARWRISKQERRMEEAAGLKNKRPFQRD